MQNLMVPLLPFIGIVALWLILERPAIDADSEMGSAIVSPGPVSRDAVAPASENTGADEPEVSPTTRRVAGSLGHSELPR